MVDLQLENNYMENSVSLFLMIIYQLLVTAQDVLTLAYITRNIAEKIITIPDFRIF